MPKSSLVARWLELEPRYAILDARRGALESAQRRATRNLEQAEQHKNRFGVVQALNTLSDCLVVAGRYEEGIDLLERALGQFRLSNMSLSLENILQARLVLACAGAGDKDRARQLLDVWQAHPSPGHHGCAHIARAMIELSDPGQLGDVETHLDEIERRADEDGTHYFRAAHEECRAALARRREDEKGCLDHLREANRLYTEMGATGHAERVAREFSS